MGTLTRPFTTKIRMRGNNLKLCAEIATLSTVGPSTAVVVEGAALPWVHIMRMMT